MNADNLRKAVKFFEEEPLRLHMGDWLQETNQPYCEFKGFRAPPCGTVACLAGSAAILMAKELYPDSKGTLTWLQRCNVHELTRSNGGWEATGVKYFELGDKGIGGRLFYLSRWPYNFSEAYHHAACEFNYCEDPAQALRLKAEMVRVLKERVEFFIETNGTDNKPVATLQQ